MYTYSTIYSAFPDFTDIKRIVSEEGRKNEMRRDEKKPKKRRGWVKGEKGSVAPQYFEKS